jgi:hypothetical protein
MLAGHQVETAYERGWAELTNGVLLQMAEDAGFEVDDHDRSGHPLSAESFGAQAYSCGYLHQRLDANSEIEIRSCGRDFGNVAWIAC